MTPTAKLHEIEPAELRELERLGDDGRSVLSVYLSLDLPEVPTERNRAAELESRLTEAEERLAAEANDGQLGTMRDCVARVREELPAALEAEDGADGFAFFCAAVPSSPSPAPSGSGPRWSRCWRRCRGRAGASRC